MPFNVSLHHGPYLLIVATGEARIADFMRAIDVASQAIKNEGTTRALIDLLAVEPLLSDYEHLALGRYVADALGHLERVATVVDERFRNRLGEGAAQIAGLQLRTFTDLLRAEQWLEA